MAAIDLMELARDHGFNERVKFVMFDVARDKAAGPPAPTGDDLNFVNGIMNGENSVHHLVMGVVVQNADPEAADDASLKSTVETLWPFYAAAWTARTL